MSYKATNSKLILAIGLSTLPFFYFYSTIDFNVNIAIQLIRQSALVTGYIAALLLVWDLAIGLRFFVNIFTPDVIYVNRIHRWIGTYVVLLVLAHPILEMIVKNESWFYLLVLDIGSTYGIWITFGRLAFLLFMIIWLTSAIVRSKIKYRPWLYIHYLAYPMMFLVLGHLIFSGSVLAGSPILQAFWFTILAAVILFGYFRLGWYAGLLKKEYKVFKIDSFANNLLLITLKHRSNSKLKSKSGQYCYLQTQPFGEAHPYTIFENINDGEYLTFGIKNLGKFSHSLKNLEQGQKINIDGAYGSFTQEGHKENLKIIVAGGIGITPFFELIKNSQNLIVVICVKTIAEIPRLAQIQDLLGSRLYIFLSQAQGSSNTSNIRYQRLTMPIFEDIINLTQLNLDQINFYICAGQGLNNLLIESLDRIKAPNVYQENFN